MGINDAAADLIPAAAIFWPGMYVV